MVRRHGWQFPAHTFQVVAITLYFLLATAFYVFMAPFLWIGGLESAAFALYSPLFIMVLLLYTRCSAINPADPGVLKNRPLLTNDRDCSFSQISGGVTLATSSPHYAMQSERDQKYSRAEQGRFGWNKAPGLCSVSGFCMSSCGWLLKDDFCYNDAKYDQPVPEQDILFCTLCNAEVRKYSKHCRSCDKCVDGFDHHCRWLNNCVGRKNYSTFIALMATSLVLLVVEWGIGAAVFIRCLVDRKGTLDQIYSKLGNGFSMFPFASVVLACTLVAFLASVPLGELFFFHLILMKKGISTYEYVMAMRAQADQTPAPVEEESELSSPGASTTVIGGFSSCRIQMQGGTDSWCTLPRTFIEHQEISVSCPCKAYGRKHKIGTIVEEKTAEESFEIEKIKNDDVEEKKVEQNGDQISRDDNLVTATGRVLSSIDQDGTGRPGKTASGNVRISAWRLAKLNAEDASRAAANALDKSSVLQKLGDRDLGNEPATDDDSRSNMINWSSFSSDNAVHNSAIIAPQKLLTPRGLPSLNPELSHLHVAEYPVLFGRPVELTNACSHIQRSISEHNTLSTIPDSKSMSSFPEDLGYRLSEKQLPGVTEVGLHATLEGAKCSESAVSSVLIHSPRPRLGWPTSQEIAAPGADAAGRHYFQSLEVAVISSDEHDTSNSVTGDNLVRSPKERNISLKYHHRNSVFWSRPGVGKFGGDPKLNKPQSRIEFGGSGISTSTYPLQILRTWPESRLAHPDSESESGTRSGSASINPIPAAVNLPLIQPRQTNASESYSVLFGPHSVPNGDGDNKNCEVLQPPPPRLDIQRVADLQIQGPTENRTSV